MSITKRTSALAMAAVLWGCQSDPDEGEKTVAVYRGKAGAQPAAAAPQPEAPAEPAPTEPAAVEPAPVDASAQAPAPTPPAEASTSEAATPSEAPPEPMLAPDPSDPAAPAPGLDPAAEPADGDARPIEVEPASSATTEIDSSSPETTELDPGDAMADPIDPMPEPEREPTNPLPPSFDFDTKRSTVEASPSDVEHMVDAGAVPPPDAESAGFDRPEPDRSSPLPVRHAPVSELDRMAFLPGGLSMQGSAFQSSKPATDLHHVALGRSLFFDASLSADSSSSCASCHDSRFGFADGQVRARGFAGAPHFRHTPSLYHAGTSASLGWDGAQEELEDQIADHLFDPSCMGRTDAPQIVDRLRASEESARLFERCGTEPSVDAIVESLAAYVRTLAPSDSAFDRYCYGELDALSPQQKQGLALFVGKANCTDCHQGASFQDGRFHDLGLARGDDRGRFEVSGRDADRYHFRTPNLRDVSRSAPYFHDGSAGSLRDVVDFYDRGGGEDSELQPLGLSDDEKEALVAFLQSLSGTPPEPIAPPMDEDL